MTAPPIAQLQTLFASASEEARHTGAGIDLRAWLDQRLAAGPGAAPPPPSLNALGADQLADGDLCKFVGMIQDVHDPEYYDGAYEVVTADGASRVCTTKYQGMINEMAAIAEAGAGSTIRPYADIVWQRTPVVCVPIPSRTSWLQQAVAPQSAVVAAKEPPTASGSPAPTGAPVPENPATAVLTSRSGGAAAAGKRSAEDEVDVAMMDADGDEQMMAGGAPVDVTDAKKRVQTCVPCTGVEGVSDASSANTAAAAWNRASAGGGVLLKLYDGDDDVKVHDLVEVYGFIERASEDEPSSMDEDDALLAPRHPMAVLSAEERKQRPPPSAQPRLHVIGVRKLPDAAALVLPAVDSSEMALALEGARAQLPAMRASLIGVLRDCLGGDTLAAEHVLLALVSRVIGRHSEHPIGKFPLYLTHCPPAAAGALHSPVAAALHEALSVLLPTCAVQPLTISGLNKGGVQPSKDLDANCIWPASLQLPHGATLLVDEATLTDGKLNETGLRALGALRALSERQMLPYDFPFCGPVDFPLDCTVVGVASASGTMLPINTKLPLRLEPANVGGGIAAAAMTTAGGGEAWVDAARRYLGLAVRAHQHLDGVPSAEMAKLAEDEFVAARQANPKIGGDDLARWLTAARLVAASALAPAVAMEHFREARRLDTERCARLSTANVGV